MKTNTATSFKTIIINNPWEQNPEASEDQRQDIQIMNQFSGQIGSRTKMGLTQMSLRSTGGGFKNPRNSGVTVDTLQMNKDKKVIVAAKLNKNNGNVPEGQERLTMPINQFKAKTKKIEENMNEETHENSGDN